MTSDPFIYKLCFVYILRTKYAFVTKFQGPWKNSHKRDAGTMSYVRQYAGVNLCTSYDKESILSPEPYLSD